MIKPRKDMIDPISEMKNKEIRIIIFYSNFKYTYFIIDNNRVAAFYVEGENDILPGNVYTGVVASVDKGSKGYFVSINEKVKTYLPIEEIPDCPYIIGGINRNRICEGDNILIKIKKSPYSTKKALSTMKIPEVYDNPDLFNKGIHSVKFTKILSGSTYLDDIFALYGNDAKVICADQQCYSLVTNKYSSIASNIELYNNNSISINALYSLKSGLENICTEKIWLKNGGYIIINPTEAMTVIDVNSGKIISKSDKEQSVMSVNMEAITEICFQIQARNLSGIIIIDLINMRDQNSRTILINELAKGLKRLNPPGNLVDITKLGLAEITRQKIKPSLYEVIKRYDKTILM